MKEKRKYLLRKCKVSRTKDETEHMYDRWAVSDIEEGRNTPAPLYVTRGNSAYHSRVDIDKLLVQNVSKAKATSAGDYLIIEQMYNEAMQPIPFRYDFSADVPYQVGAGYIEDPVATKHFWDEVEKRKVEQKANTNSDKSTERPSLTSSTNSQNLKRASRRAQKGAEILCLCNRFDVMWTLTFSPPPDDIEEIARLQKLGIKRLLDLEKQRSRAEVNKVWNTFTTKLRREVVKKSDPLRWLKVLERHDSEKSSIKKMGTYHIHLASNLRINKDVLQRLWGYGVVWYTDFARRRHVESADNPESEPSLYLTKYIDKDFVEARGRGERAYSCSTSCIRPKTYYDNYISSLWTNPMMAFQLEGMHPRVRARLTRCKNLAKLEVPTEDVGFGPGIYKVVFDIVRHDGQIKEVVNYKRIRKFNAKRA